jgi:hypothetical protein
LKRKLIGGYVAGNYDHLTQIIEDFMLTKSYLGNVAFQVL